MDCSEIRGFNYSGSWGTSGLDLWRHHDREQMAAEIGRGKQYFPGWNVCRWWLDESAFQRDPDRFMSDLEDGLAVFDQNAILVMPVLFNRWQNPECEYGGVWLEQIVPGMGFMNKGVDNLFAHTGAEWPREPSPREATFKSFLETVVGTHRSDLRIFAWDLCNEPFMGPYVYDPQNPIRAAELRWLTWCHETCKRVGAEQPLTIGSHSDMAIVELCEPISDIISFHPYYMWNDPEHDEVAFVRYVDQAVACAATCGITRAQVPGGAGCFPPAISSQPTASPPR